MNIAEIIARGSTKAAAEIVTQRGVIHTINVSLLTSNLKTVIKEQWDIMANEWADMIEARADNNILREYIAAQCVMLGVAAVDRTMNEVMK